MEKKQIRLDHGIGSIVRSVLGEFSPQGLINFIKESSKPENSDLVKNGEHIVSIKNSSPMSWITVIKNDRNQKQKLIQTSYPHIKFSNILKFKITSIDEWDDSDGTEAIITGQLGEAPFAVSFFDTKYVLNKSKYRINKQYKFNLASVAFQLEKRTNLKIDGKDPITKRKKVYDSSKMTMFVPSKAYFEEFYFRVPTNKDLTADIKFENKKFFKLDYYMNSFSEFEHFFEFPMYVSLYSSKNYIPKKGDPVHGMAWLMGYLA